MTLQIQHFSVQLLGIAIALLTLPLEPVQASIQIDFESLATTGIGEVSVGQTYVEDGFELRSTLPSTMYSPHTGNAARYAGSTSLYNGSSSGMTTLTKVGGSAFELISIDLSELVINRLGPIAATFTGTKSDLSTVSQSFSLDGTFGLESFAFPTTFTDLIAVKWSQGGSQTSYQFDNIVLNVITSGVVPEATSSFVWGGLALTALIGKTSRRRRNKA